MSKITVAALQCALGSDDEQENIARIDETLTTMRLFDGWYSDVARLPKSVHLGALKLGAKVTRFLPGLKKS